VTGRGRTCFVTPRFLAILSTGRATPRAGRVEVGPALDFERPGGSNSKYCAISKRPMENYIRIACDDVERHEPQALQTSIWRVLRNLLTSSHCWVSQ